MKDIKGYEGLYAVTSCGKVWSYRSQKFLTPSKDKDGYLQLHLHKDGKRKDYKVHRLVAEAYIPNPENKSQVNHKDEVKQHNWINNLEWVTAKENANYGTRNIRSVKNREKAIYCIELDKVFENQVVAAKEIGVTPSAINICLKGKTKTCGGYHWKYVNMEDK